MMTTEAIIKRAEESYRKDARFRALARSAVARAMSEHGPIDPEAADQGAYNVALRAAVLLLQRVFEQDAELHAARQERDQYKALAELAGSATPLRLFIPDAPATIPAHERLRDMVETIWPDTAL